MIVQMILAAWNGKKAFLAWQYYMSPVKHSDDSGVQEQHKYNFALVFQSLPMGF